ncbi:hypothetical protein PROFUN_04494 [Planoprotostelium fungivorum]|uniref:Uncharacterized protein n=1 Tax=Planoprotostelium fungivorum TaxID=1890364 RepID=A0A2P6NBD4_9EUKA|nr:hypothetical protein PROFUN_04494 [Planoprotostelium fungivorum]
MRDFWWTESHVILRSDVWDLLFWTYRHLENFCGGSSAEAERSTRTSILISIYENVTRSTDFFQRSQPVRRAALSSPCDRLIHTPHKT